MNNPLERIPLFNEMRGKPALRIGAFYWVRTVADAEREATMPQTEWQPARYTGQCGDASAAHTWDFIGRASADGHHFVDVMQVGPEIVRDEPESDSSGVSCGAPGDRSAGEFVLMPAYSFKKRFINPIKVGLGQKIHAADTIEEMLRPKRQTIRAIGKRRHARPGEIVQLYYGMRTKQCFKIGEARCISALPVCLTFISWGSAIVGSGKVPENCYFDERLHLFAQADGFDTWDAMKEFWRAEHAGLDKFEGVLIRWDPLT